MDYIKLKKEKNLNLSFIFLSLFLFVFTFSNSIQFTNAITIENFFIESSFKTNGTNENLTVKINTSHTSNISYLGEWYKNGNLMLNLEQNNQTQDLDTGLYFKHFFDNTKYYQLSNSPTLGLTRFLSAGIGGSLVSNSPIINFKDFNLDSNDFFYISNSSNILKLTSSGSISTILIFNLTNQTSTQTSSGKFTISNSNEIYVLTKINNSDNSNNISQISKFGTDGIQIWNKTYDSSLNSDVIESHKSVVLDRNPNNNVDIIISQYNSNINQIQIYHLNYSGDIIHQSTISNIEISKSFQTKIDKFNNIYFFVKKASNINSILKYDQELNKYYNIDLQRNSFNEQGFEISSTNIFDNNSIKIFGNYKNFSNSSQTLFTEINLNSNFEKENVNGSNLLNIFNITSNQTNINDSINVCITIFENTNNSVFSQRSCINNFKVLQEPILFSQIISPLENSSFIPSSNISIISKTTSTYSVDNVSVRIQIPNQADKIIELSQFNQVENLYKGNFIVPQQLGRYNLTFTINDSYGKINNQTTSYFNIYNTTNILFNFTSFGDSLFNLTLNILSRDSIVQTVDNINSSFNLDILNSSFDLQFSAYNSKIITTLNKFNITSTTNNNFGIDKHNENSNFLVTYGIKTNYSFSNATVRIYYDELQVTNENLLFVYKCNTTDYDFQTRLCNSNNFNLITQNIFQNKEANYFEILVTSFSGFGILQQTSTESTSSSSISNYWGFIEQITCDIDEKYNNLSKSCVLKNKILSLPKITTLDVIVNDDSSIIPDELFDITFELFKTEISDITELSGKVTFVSFGSIPISVNLDFKIFNNENELIYFNDYDLIVDIEEVVIEDFDFINSKLFGPGDYKIILKTSYGDNVVDEFKSNFKIPDNSYLSYPTLIYLLYFIGFIFLIMVLFMPKEDFKNLKFENIKNKFQSFFNSKKIVKSNKSNKKLNILFFIFLSGFFLFTNITQVNAAKIVSEDGNLEIYVTGKSETGELSFSGLWYKNNKPLFERLYSLNLEKIDDSYDLDDYVLTESKKDSEDNLYLIYYKKNLKSFMLAKYDNEDNFIFSKIFNNYDGRHLNLNFNSNNDIFVSYILNGNKLIEVKKISNSGQLLFTKNLNLKISGLKKFYLEFDKDDNIYISALKASAHSSHKLFKLDENLVLLNSVSLSNLYVYSMDVIFDDFIAVFIKGKKEKTGYVNIYDSNLKFVTKFFPTNSNENYYDSIIVGIQYPHIYVKTVDKTNTGYLKKINIKNNHTVWENTFPSSHKGQTTLKVDDANNIYLTSFPSSSSRSDFLKIHKFDSFGKEVFNYKLVGYKEDMVNSIEVSKHGDIYLLGNNFPNDIKLSNFDFKKIQNKKSNIDEYLDYKRVIVDGDLYRCKVIDWCNNRYAEYGFDEVNNFLAWEYLRTANSNDINKYSSYNLDFKFDLNHNYNYKKNDKVILDNKIYKCISESWCNNPTDFYGIGDTSEILAWELVGDDGDDDISDGNGQVGYSDDRFHFKNKFETYIHKFKSGYLNLNKNSGQKVLLDTLKSYITTKDDIFHTCVVPYIKSNNNFLVGGELCIKNIEVIEEIKDTSAPTFSEITTFDSELAQNSIIVLNLKIEDENDLDLTQVVITYPDLTKFNLDLKFINGKYETLFVDTSQTGTYNYQFISTDIFKNKNISEQFSFDIVGKVGTPLSVTLGATELDKIYELEVNQFFNFSGKINCLDNCDNMRVELFHKSIVPEKNYENLQLSLPSTEIANYNYKLDLSKNEYSVLNTGYFLGKKNGIYGGDSFEFISGDSLFIPFKKSLNTEKFTTTFWFKKSVFKSVKRPILSSGYFNTGYRMYIDSDNIVKFSYLDSTNNMAVISIPEFKRDVWNHFTIKYDGVFFYLYVDSRLSKKVRTTYKPIKRGHFVLGADRSSRGVTRNFLNGLIDEVKVFDKALNDYEIAILYKSSNYNKIETSDCKKVSTEECSFSFLFSSEKYNLDSVYSDIKVKVSHKTDLTKESIFSPYMVIKNSLPDSTVPQISDYELEKNNFEPNEVLNLKIKAKDDSGLKRVYAFIIADFSEYVVELNNDGEFYTSTYTLSNKPLNYNIRYYAIDNSDNRIISPIENFNTIDSSLPTLSDIEPVSSSIEIGKNLTLQIKAQDNRGIKLVKAIIKLSDGNDLLVNIFDSNSNPNSIIDNIYTKQIKIPNVPGTVSVEYIITDVSDNQIKSQVQNSNIVDRSDPVISYIYPQPEVHIARSRVYFGLLVSDDVLIDNVEVEFVKPNSEIIKLNLKYVQEIFLDSYYKGGYLLDDTVGDFQFKYIVTDSSGNKVTSEIFNFNIKDTINPRFTKITPVDLAVETNEYITFHTLTADDVLVDYVIVNLTKNSGENEIINLTRHVKDYYYTHYKLDKVIGEFKYTYKVFDTAGNSKTSDIYSFLAIDSKSPLIYNSVQIDSNVNVGSVLNLGINTTDGVEISSVIATITYNAINAQINSNLISTDFGNSNSQTVDTKEIIINLDSNTQNFYSGVFNVPQELIDYKIFYTITDTSNNFIKSQFQSFTTKDEILPQVTNFSKFPQEVISTNTSLNLQVSAQDNIEITSVKSYIILPDGTSKYINLKNSNSQNYNSDYLIPELTGEYKIQFVVTDNSDNELLTDVQTVTVIDTNFPKQSNFTTLNHKNYLTSDILNLSVIASDNIGIKEVTTRILSTEISFNLILLQDPNNENMFTTHFEIPDQYGQYYISYTVKDLSDNSINFGDHIFNVSDGKVPFKTIVLDSEQNIVDYTFKVLNQDEIIYEKYKFANYGKTRLKNISLILEYSSYNDSVKLKLNNFTIPSPENIFESSPVVIGLDKYLIEENSELVLGISNNQIFNNAYLNINYNDLNVTFVDNLRILKCSDYDFEGRACNSVYVDMLDNIVHNKFTNSFEIVTDSFSSFKIIELPEIKSDTLNKIISDSDINSVRHSSGIYYNNFCQNGYKYDNSQRKCISRLSNSESTVLNVETFQSVSTKDLFDINFELFVQEIYSTEDLVFRVSFDNFKDEPTFVNLLLTIYDRNGIDIATYKSVELIQTQSVLVISSDKFKDLELENGEYSAILKIVYGEEKITDHFIQYFNLETKSFENSSLKTKTILMAVVCVLALIGAFRLTRKYNPLKIGNK